MTFNFLNHFAFVLVLVLTLKVYFIDCNNTVASCNDESATDEQIDFDQFDPKDASNQIKNIELSYHKILKHLQANGKLRTRRVLQALSKFDRMKFMDTTEQYPVLTLIDLPHNIGHNAFMESPTDHCIILEILSNHLNAGDKVLEIGTGSGYLTTLFGALVGVGGKVHTIEHVPELLEAARSRIKLKADKYMKRINFYIGQGKRGYSKEAPFSAIYVGGSMDTIPIDLIKQLRPGGRLLVPIKTDKEDPILTIIDRYMNNTVITTQVQRIQIEPLRELKEQRALNRTWEDEWLEEFHNSTDPTGATIDPKNYTGWYHTDKLFMSLYNLVSDRPHLFTYQYNKDLYTILGTKPKPTYVTENPLHGI